MVSEEQEKIAIEQFRSASQCENELQKVPISKKLTNIQSFADLRGKISRKIERIKKNTTFTINEWLVSLLYGNSIDPFFVFQTSPEDVERIRKVLDSSKQLKQSNSQAKRKRGNQQTDQDLYAKMNMSQTWFEIKRNDIYDDFFMKIKPIIGKYLKSPFVIVNLNAWKTKPNMEVAQDSGGNTRGPNRLHKDGMPAGHFKCMIYIKPLNDAYGKVQIGERIFESEKPGFSLIFNTEGFHQSIPGDSEDRYVFEITIMRTIVEVDLLKYYPGTPDSIHLLQAYHAYL
jgi:hypothetical protein